MTLLEYRIFHTVAQQGSFAKAAQTLHLTPSAISHAVSSMEETCGFALFVRSKNGVTFTRSGELLYPMIRQALGADDMIAQTIGELNGVQKGVVKIAAFNSVCMTWLPHIVQLYKKMYPGVSIEINQGTYEDVAEWIKSGAADLGFLSAPSAKDLAYYPLYRDRLMCVAPKGTKTKNPGYMSAEEMRGKAFVVQGDSTNADILAFLNKYRLSERATCHVRDDLSTIAMVEGGFGLCILPSLVLERAHGGVDVYPIEPMEYREFGIAVLNPDMLSPAARQMAAQIELYAENMRLRAAATNGDFSPARVFSV